MAFNTILVPTDFSAASATALRQACELAEATGAALCLLHAIEPPYALGGYGEYYSLPQDFVDGLYTQARASLDHLLTADQKARYRATTVLCQGAAAHEILNHLTTHPEVGLVVMSTHGRGGVSRLMMGSVADKVVRAATCPVMTMRPADAAVPGAGRAA